MTHARRHLRGAGGRCQGVLAEHLAAAPGATYEVARLPRN